MRRATILSLSCLVLGSSVAFGSGINLSWDDCGKAGTQNATFACNSNSGVPFQMVASYVPPAGVDEFLGLNAEMEVGVSNPTLPNWWALGNTGQCRSGALSTSFDFTSGPFTCADAFQGQAAGGYAYEYGYGGADRARLRITCAVPFDSRLPLDSGTEYYAFVVRISRTKTTGAGSCSGCETPGCVTLNSIQLFQPPEAANDPTITNPNNRNYVTWQNGFCPFCPCPANQLSWGQVKCKFR